MNRWEIVAARPYDVAMPAGYEEEISRLTAAHQSDTALRVAARSLMSRIDGRRAIVEHDVLEAFFHGVTDCRDLDGADRKVFRDVWDAAIDNPLWRTSAN